MTALSLLLVASGSAAVPKAGKLYTGPTSASYNGFTAPVSFTVSKNGRQLLSFTWAGGGCIGVGGPGNAWTNPKLNYKVGTINVSRTGSFSVKNVRTKVTVSPGVTKTTISTVEGHFKNARTATGTIHFTQALTRSKPCSAKVAFTAVLGPAPGALHKTSPANGATVPGAPTLRWTASRDATSYKYCVTTSKSGTCSRWVSTHASTHATPSGLTAGTTYYWEVLASSVHGTVAADNGFFRSFKISGGAIKPKAGRWAATSLSGPVTGSGGSLNSTDSVTVTSIFFTVTGDQATVSGFGFAYNDLGYPFDSCIGRGSTVDQVAAPIARGQFSTPAASTWTWSDPMDYGTFTGTFDSPTSAHGTAWLRDYIGAYNCKEIGYANTGNFSWTATPQP